MSALKSADTDFRRNTELRRAFHSPFGPPFPTRRKACVVVVLMRPYRNGSLSPEMDKMMTRDCRCRKGEDVAGEALWCLCLVNGLLPTVFHCKEGPSKGVRYPNCSVNACMHYIQLIGGGKGAG